MDKFSDDIKELIDACTLVYNIDKIGYVNRINDLLLIVYDNLKAIFIDVNSKEMKHFTDINLVKVLRELEIVFLTVFDDSGGWEIAIDTRNFEVIKLKSITFMCKNAVIGMDINADLIEYKLTDNKYEETNLTNGTYKSLHYRYAYILNDKLYLVSKSNAFYYREHIKNLRKSLKTKDIMFNECNKQVNVLDDTEVKNDLTIYIVENYSNVYFAKDVISDSCVLLGMKEYDIIYNDGIELGECRDINWEGIDVNENIKKEVESNHINFNQALFLEKDLVYTLRSGLYSKILVKRGKYNKKLSKKHGIPIMYGGIDEKFKNRYRVIMCPDRLELINLTNSLLGKILLFTELKFKVKEKKR